MLDGELKTFLYGAFAFIPLLLFALVALTILDIVHSRWAESLIGPHRAFWAVASFGFVGLALYIADVWRNPKVPAEKRALWTVVILAANWYALPFYFWFYIRNAGTRAGR